MYIGVDIGGTTIKAGLVNSKGRIVKYVETPTEARSSKAKVMKNILDTISQVFRKDVKGIGIGSAGQVSAKGIVLHSPNIPVFDNAKLVETVKKKFRKRVELNNDANCFALAEAHFGKGKKYKRVVGLILGTGCGAGVVYNKKVLSGKHFVAGEFGMIPYKDKVFEDYVAGRYVKSLAKKYGLKNTDPAHVYEMGMKGSKTAKKIFKEQGEHVGMLLVTIILSVNPDIIVFGGGVSKSFKLFEEQMKKTLKKNLVYKKAFNTRLAQSTMKHAGVLGAAALVV